MKGFIVVAGVFLAIHMAEGFGFGLGGGGCGCGAPPPPPPPPPPAPCAPPPQQSCPAPPPCPRAVCPPQPVYEQCPVCPPIPVYEVLPCPPCPPPPQTICVAHQIPAPQPAAPVSCCAQSPCARPCKKRILGSVTHDVDEADTVSTCNDNELKQILEDSIAVDVETSKHAIHNATLELKGKHDVICAYSDFSYIVNSDSYCQLTQDDITCYVFKQA